MDYEYKTKQMKILTILEQWLRIVYPIFHIYDEVSPATSSSQYDTTQNTKISNFSFQTHHQSASDPRMYHVLSVPGYYSDFPEDFDLRGNTTNHSNLY